MVNNLVDIRRKYKRLKRGFGNFSTKTYVFHVRAWLSPAKGIMHIRAKLCNRNRFQNRSLLDITQVFASFNILEQWWSANVQRLFASDTAVTKMTSLVVSVRTKACTI